MDNRGFVAALLIDAAVLGVVVRCLANLFLNLDDQGDLRINFYLWNWVDPFIVAWEVVLSVNLVDIRLINILTRSSAISYDKMQNNQLYNKHDKEQCVLYDRIRFENNQFSNKLDKGQSSTGGVCNYAKSYVQSLQNLERRQWRPSQGRCRSLLTNKWWYCLKIYSGQIGSSWYL